MLEIRRVWVHDDEPGAVHFMLAAGFTEGHFKVSRLKNPGLYDFVLQNSLPTQHSRTAATPERH